MNNKAIQSSISLEMKLDNEKEIHSMAWMPARIGDVQDAEDGVLQEADSDALALSGLAHGGAAIAHQLLFALRPIDFMFTATDPSMADVICQFSPLALAKADSS